MAHDPLSWNHSSLAQLLALLVLGIWEVDDEKIGFVQIPNSFLPHLEISGCDLILDAFKGHGKGRLHVSF